VGYILFLAGEKSSAIHEFLQQSTQWQKASVGLPNVKGKT
jgi:hypothetical protein